MDAQKHSVNVNGKLYCLVFNKDQLTTRACQAALTLFHRQDKTSQKHELGRI